VSEAGEGRRGRLTLGVVLFISGVLVVGAFNPSPHNGGDNAGYVSLAYSLVANHSYTDLYDPARLPHTKYPPVFPGLLAFLIMLGARSWTVLKSVSALSTIAAVGFTYLWAERRLGALGGVAVALVFAASSAVVYYSHWILSDPLFLALTMASLWALEAADESDARRGYLVAGIAAAGLAYFTRSAGLPLLVALFAWLGLRRRWRPWAVSAAVIGLPAALWWWRGRGAGVAEYGTEFWLVDPYQPALGRVGLGGLLGRFGGNLVAYVTAHGPGGVLGVRGSAVAAFGVALTTLALAGWLLAARKRIGPAELFLPLYTGLILLWPEVWSGDRFALPLYPLLFLYAAVALHSAGARFGRSAQRTLAVVALSVTLLPAGGSWLGSVREASACASRVRVAGPFGCYGGGIGSFVAAAEWMGAALPDGSAVLTRKPRLFYVLSGIPSRTFPFEDDPAVHLALADRLGARYLLLDQWDGLAGRYVGGALQRYPQAFCSVRGFGEGQSMGTQLLGILPPEARGAAAGASGGEIRIARCPGDYVRAGAPSDYSSSSSMRIPLLDLLDP
jgi:4-amino-4-deoxy-L-arabinose transferase-like glycosyltransferase